MIDFEINEQCEYVRRAVRARVRLEHPDAPGTVDEKCEAEYEVFLALRALVSIYIDAARWSIHDLNRDDHATVSRVIDEGRKWVLTERLIKALSSSLRHLEELSKRIGVVAAE